MNRIASFQADHTKITPGIYVSRIDGDVTTYDLRMKTPNAGDYLSNAQMHSFEHMLATFMRNSAIANDVVYVGPMGCQTGFYLLTRGHDNNEVLGVLTEALRGIIAYEGEVFGKSERECGNYRNLSLDEAKTVTREYLTVLSSRTQTFEYRK